MKEGGMNRPYVKRIAALADLHCPRTGEEVLKPLFNQIAAEADVILLCGDLTDYGKPEEAKILAQALSVVGRVPVLAVLGNHDHESGAGAAVEHILCDSGVHVLDGTSREIDGIGYVGVKGFAGGFGDRSLQPWGESVLKQFVREGVEEALKLESALAKMTTGPRIVLLHYAPIRATVEGEPAEIIPFLGSSRLEDPLNRYAVTAVFHGHAHQGSPEGNTREGVPVYNVAMPLLLRRYPEQQPVRFIDVSVDTEAVVT
jgi:Icc-related predicted phosphoesterase